MSNYKQIDQQKIDYVPVGNIIDFKDGRRLFIDVDGLPIMIVCIDGNYYAIADVCSHDDGPVGEGNVEGYEIVCPRHGARFDIRSGKVLALPAFVDIPAYPVRVNGDQIEVGIPIEE